jgi:hypothetical protein
MKSIVDDIFVNASNRRLTRRSKMRRAARIARPLLRPGASRCLSPKTLHTLRKPIPAPHNIAPWSLRRYSTQQPSSSSAAGAATASAKACPTCGSPLDIREISCAECGALSPLPENINYLSLFKISAEQPFQFDIDVGLLKREYLKLMSKVHPDSVINSSDVSLPSSSCTPSPISLFLILFNTCPASQIFRHQNLVLMDSRNRSE